MHHPNAHKETYSANLADRKSVEIGLRVQIRALVCLRQAVAGGTSKHLMRGPPDAPRISLDLNQAHPPFLTRHPMPFDPVLYPRTPINKHTHQHTHKQPAHHQAPSHGRPRPLCCRPPHRLLPPARRPHRRTRRPHLWLPRPQGRGLRPAPRVPDALPGAGARDGRYV